MNERELESALDVLAGRAQRSDSASCIAPHIVDALVELIDELTLGVVFEFHRALKLGLVCPCFGNPVAPHK